MQTLTIHNMDEDLVDRLRERAARNGRSMEAEMREILCRALTPDLKAEALRKLEGFRASVAGGRLTPSDLLMRQTRGTV